MTRFARWNPVPTGDGSEEAAGGKRRLRRRAQDSIIGLLGPNGAGKTTTLRMVTTLLPIGAGSAIVAGYDVTGQQNKVRAQIGYVSQLGGADDLATGRENLILQGRLLAAPRRSGPARTRRRR